MGKTSIEYADESWQVVTGCTPVNEGCRNCYAARLAAGRLKNHRRYQGLAKMKDGKARWTGLINSNRRLFDEPLRWRKPRVVFVAPMGDLFHKYVPAWALGHIWATMEKARQHTFLILTKRPDRMSELMDIRQQYLTDKLVVLPNLWLGVSVSTQEDADKFIPPLLQTPAAGHWVSAEPLLGPIDLAAWLPHRCPVHLRVHSLPQPADCLKPETGFLRWVVTGGESGPRARPAHPDWVRKIRDDCMAASVPFYFKQWGEWAPARDHAAQQEAPWLGKQSLWVDIHGSQRKRYSAMMHEPSKVCRIRKKRAGRLLDGQAWDETPFGS